MESSEIKTKEQLLKEIEQLKTKVADLENSENEILNYDIKLKKSEERYKGIINSTASCVAVYKAIENGKNFVFVDFNPMAEKVEQISKDKVIGRKVTEIFQGIDEFGLLKVFQNVWKTGESKYFPVSVYKDKRKEVYRENYVYKLFSDEIVAVYQDLTEQKQAEQALKDSEERFKFLYSVTFEGIVIHKNGIIKDVNESFMKITGYTREEALGENLLDYIPDIKDKAKIMLNIVKKNAKPYVVKAKRKDGSTFIAELEAKNTKDLDNKTIRIVSVRDVSARIEAEKALHESEEKLRNIFENSTSLFYSHTPDHILTYLSPQVKDVLGYTVNEAIVKWIYLVSDNPINEIGFKNTEKAIETGKRQAPYELELVKKSGERIWVEVREFPKVENGKTIAIIGSLMDISERKQAEDALIANEQSMRNLFNAMQDIVFEMDYDGRYLYVAPTSPEIMFKPSEDTIGKTLHDVFPKQQADIFLKFIRKCLDENKPDRIIYPLKINNKTTWFEGRANPIAKNRLLYIATDITERKRAEQIQQVLLNISNAVITTESLKDFIKQIQIELGKLMDTKNFFVALYDKKTGYINLPYFMDEKDDIDSFPAKKTLTGLVIKKGQSILVNDAKAKKLEKEGEIEKVGFDSEIWLGVPLKIKGEVIGAFVLQSYSDSNAYTEKDKSVLEFISNQISISIERKKTEQDLKTALEKATESDMLKSAFLVNMSHEIRTPMNGILSFTNLLKDANLTGEEQKEFIKIIDQSGIRMLNTINDIIDISKLETGQEKVILNEININEKIEDLYKFFKPEAEEKGMQLIYKNLLTKQKVNINTDENKINSILTNLIKNAIKYTDEGVIEFGYELTKDKFLFFIKDTGIGVPANKQEAIFNRFEQADIGNKRTFQGSGLGLAISKAYVEMLGGNIWIESVEGKGSVFYFTLPYKKSDKEIFTAKNVFDNNMPEDKIKDLKILIAEDEEYADKFISIIIKDFSKEILHAKTGKQTVEIFKNNNNIDLILMDIQMPDMDGYEATRKIREFNKDVIIIAQTAYAFAEDENKAIEAGCNDYISKPIKKDKLIEKVKKYFV